ncbi:serine hydrolase domain-containing protein [Hanstruepera ponticola]|uniref:serine hydrolase domain-containing protein n=1 Tax=Hanstruepera ponticola TaxID=2042995 RepID=UPI00177B8BC7|nr:serine hydrolase domain-containing protein [Hanstruepera ponticola]
MKKLFVYVLISFSILFSIQSTSQVLDSKTIEAKIDALVPTQVNDTTPGLVIGIVQNSKLIFSKGYGLANLSYGMANNPKMVYNVGSVSKQFLGYAFAMLHVKGDLNIDDPVGKYLEDWPEFEHAVTLRHLLTHTSGYREAYTMSNLAGRIVGVDRLSRAECLNVVRKQPELEFVPGSNWTYNSTAWVILAEVFEKVTGEKADAWVENNMLKPLGMHDTQIESYVGEVITNAAESYVFDPEQGYINQESNRAIFGAAEVYSSIDDLVKWVNNYRTATIGGKAVNKLFLEPFILNDGSDSEYALGIGNSSYNGLKLYRHTGGHEAFATQLSYYPEQDLGIITISNYGGKGWLATSKIADLLLGKFMTHEDKEEVKSIDLAKELLEPLRGLYVSSNFNRTLEIGMVQDSLTINGDSKLIPLSENTFYVNGWDSQLVLNKEANGNATLTFTDNSREIFTKVDRWQPTEIDLKGYEGDYWSEELETLYHLTVTDGKLTIKHRWLGEIPLEPLTRDLFKTDWSYNVKFVRDSNQNISGFSIYSGRTLNVYFKRK